MGELPAAARGAIEGAIAAAEGGAQDGAKTGSVGAGAAEEASTAAPRAALPSAPPTGRVVQGKEQRSQPQGEEHASVEAVGTGTTKAETTRRASETDQFTSDADKLAFRIAQGMLSVVDLESSDAIFDNWLLLRDPALVGMRAYVVKPGKGGRRYLGNVAARLRAVGFEHNEMIDLWIRPKVVGGEERLLDVTTLRPKD
uniref:Uncharacterized protein n=1 Tax=Coccolithus braarudii TaxID=221442 RepID=A0A7S0LR03_9EUKA|mmetsp:Transcript_49027/g.104699  ORF Transcript_49027/g.104699 Transcript_49027/m.104699 type:complete len:199 (+) Transcript_49027:3-599(+)